MSFPTCVGGLGWEVSLLDWCPVHALCACSHERRVILWVPGAGGGADGGQRWWLLLGGLGREGVVSEGVLYGAASCIVWLLGGVVGMLLLWLMRHGGCGKRGIVCLEGGVPCG